MGYLAFAYRAISLQQLFQNFVESLSWQCGENLHEPFLDSFGVSGIYLPMLGSDLKKGLSGCCHEGIFD
jgi:hypothetical protein